MRVLSVKQPWADAIVHGPKRVENRTWLTQYRGPLAIHASLVPDHGALRLPPQHALFRWLGATDSVAPDVRGAIIGTTYLKAAHDAEHCNCHEQGPGIREWAHQGHGVTHLILAQPIPLAVPYPWRGSLGIRELPDALSEQLTAEP